MILQLFATEVNVLSIRQKNRVHNRVLQDISTGFENREFVKLGDQLLQYMAEVF